MNVFFNKLLFSLMVLVYSITGLVNSCHSSSNLALYKPYSVSPAPGYPLSAPPSDKTSLTDGRYSVGNFWTQKTTVGWWPVRSVEILIDLEKVSSIGTIRFNTARGESAGVLYPVHIFAFVGQDKDHLVYAGDIAGDPENLPGPYRVKRFELGGIAVRGRYVLLEIVTAKSKSVFCDEIEVLEGGHDRGKTGRLTVEESRKLADRLKWFSPYQDFIKNIAMANGSAMYAFPGLTDRIALIKQKILNLASAEEVDAIESEILMLRADMLRGQLQGKQLLVEAVKPWAPLPLIALSAGSTPSQLSLQMPQGGYAQDALLVTNLSQGNRLVTLSCAMTPDGSPELSLYQVPFVKSLATEYVADPLVPVASGFTLRPGESRMVFVSAMGKAPGSWQTNIEVISDGQSESIPVNCTVFPITLPESPSLNAVNWGYLNFDLISDRKEQAVQDLLSHHTKIMVIPPSYLKGANQKETADLSDFIRLENYLKAQKGATRVILGLGLGTDKHTTVSGLYPFLSERWKVGFSKWYVNAILAARRSGFSENQLYLYPYDEMGGQQIDDFVRFAGWLRGSFPSAKLYATLGEATLATKGWEKILPYLEIAQAFNEDMFRTGHPFKGEPWIYSTQGPSRSLSPYTYYRLMSWKAFLYGYRGVGFWSYADTDVNDNPDSSWDDANRGARDFGVIYRGDGKSIVSSRRWEAWRMGIEDYELLTVYGKARGEVAARTLAKAVLDHPEDTSKADEVRRQILMELAGL